MSRFVIAICCLFLFNTAVTADVTINFAEGDQFDGDMIGGTADFNDPMSVLDATLTTRGGHAGITINTGNGFFALGPAAVNAWDNFESWSFDWSHRTQFQSVSFNQLDSDVEQVFMQSDDWIGGGYQVAPNQDRVTFDNATGTFTMDRGFAGGTLQTWTLFDLTSGQDLEISAYSDINFSMGGVSTTVMTQMVFSIVPEPSTCLLASLPLVVLVVIRSRRNRRG